MVLLHLHRTLPSKLPCCNLNDQSNDINERSQFGLLHPKEGSQWTSVYVRGLGNPGPTLGFASSEGICPTQWGRREKNSEPLFLLINKWIPLWYPNTVCVLPNGLDISVWLAQYQPFSLRRTSHSREEKRDFKEFTIWLNLKGISGEKKKKHCITRGLCPCQCERLCKLKGES